METIKIVQLNSEDLKQLLDEAVQRNAQLSNHEIETPKLLTVNDVADILSVTSRTVYNYIERGEIRSFNNGSVIRVHPSDLKKFIDSNLRKEVTSC